MSCENQKIPFRSAGAGINIQRYL